MLARYRWILVLAVLLFPAASHAAPSSHVLARVLSATTHHTIPAAWAGIWSFEDTTRDCTTHDVISTDAGLDTLCAGASFDADSVAGFTFDCTGTISDNDVDMTCTGSFSLPFCDATFSNHNLASRTGDVLTYRTTIAFIYTPTNCAFVPDRCREISGRSTRIAPSPPTCATTAVKQTTWGRVKTHYR